MKHRRIVPAAAAAGLVLSLAFERALALKPDYGTRRQA
jgi:hypothetical protein